MKNLLFALMACAALGAQAKWSYDSAAKRLVETTDSEGAVTNWVLNVTGSGDDLTLGKPVSGSGVLDLTSCSADTDGKRVVTVGEKAFHSNTTLTSFIGPDVTTVKKYAFYNSRMQVLRLSDELQSLDGEGALSGMSYLTEFHPLKMTHLTYVNGIRLFQSMGNSTTATFDLELPALTTMGNEMFNSARVTSLKLPKVTVIPASAFRSCGVLTNVVVSPQLVSIGSDAFNSASALKRFDAGYCTTVSSYAFKAMSSLSNLIFRSTITGGSYIMNNGPKAINLVFYGEPPTLSQNAFKAWSRFCVPDGRTRQTWLDFVKPYADDFETFKSTQSDYPGSDAFGVYKDKNDSTWYWVMDYPYVFRSTGSCGEYKELASLFDCTLEAQAGDVFTGSAPTADQVITDDLRIAVRGWKLYEIASDGSATQVDASNENTYSVTYVAGKRYRLEWNLVRRWKQNVTAGNGGTVDVAVNPFFADEGSVVTVTATPSSSDYSLKAWMGAPAGATQEGNVLSYAVSGPETVTAAFKRAWKLTDNVLDDGVNWTFTVTTCADGTLNLATRTAGSGDLDLSAVAQDIGNSVTAVENNLFYNSTTLTSFVGPDVTIVGNGAFYGCKSVTNFVFSSALKSIGNTSFSWVQNVVSFFPTDMTNLTTYGNQAFESAFSNTDYVPTFKFPKVTSNLQVFRSGMGCVIATNITVLPENAFWQCTKLTNVVLSSDLTTIGVNAFNGASKIRNFDLGAYPKLTSIGQSAFESASSYEGPVDLRQQGLTSLPAYAFKNCSKLSKVSIGAQITSIGDTALGGLAPSANLYFFGDPPTMGTKAIYSANGESQDVRARMWVVGGMTSETWANLVVPYASTFEEYKETKTDYPGSRAFGLYQCSGSAEYNWVADCPYSFFVTATHDDCLGPDPGYGVEIGLDDGTVLEGAAPDGEQVASAAKHYYFRGWKLYEVNDAGDETLVDEATTNQYRFVYEEGRQWKLVWQVERRFNIDVEVRPGGTIDLVDPYVMEGSNLVITATPSSGYTVEGWPGTLPEGAVTAGNTIAFTVRKEESFAVSFVRGWAFDSQTGVLDDGINWTLAANEVDGGLCITNRIAGSGDLNLSRVEQDTGLKVVAVGNGSRTIGNFLGSGLKSFYGPDVVTLNDWCFYGSSMTNCWVSDDIIRIGQDALGGTYYMQTFHPTCFRALKTTGSQAMECMGMNVPAHFNFEFPLVECFGVGGLFRVSMDSVVATNMTRLADRCFWDCRQLTNIVMGACVTTMQYAAFMSLPKYKGPVALDVTTVPSQAFQYSAAITSIVFRAQLTSIAGGAIDGVGDKLEISFTGLPPTFGDNAIRASNGMPIRLCVPLRAKNRAAWMALAEPNDALFRSEYVGRDDFPGKKNGYRTVGIINTGTAGTPVYNWLIDTRYHSGLQIIVR